MKPFSVFFTVALFAIFCIFSDAEERKDDAKPLRSSALHNVAMPRHQAVGMWLPEHAHLDKIHAHRHSRHARPKNRSTFKSASSSTGWVMLPHAGPGTAKADYTDLRGEVLLEKRLAPALVFAIKALGPAVEFLGNTVCTFIALSSSASKTSKVICFVLVNLLGLLSGFGALFTLNKFHRGSGAVVRDAFGGGISTVQNTQPVGRSVFNNTVPWFHNHMDTLNGIYAQSLVEDEKSLSRGTAHFDQNTGHMLRSWDIIMSHIYPVRHSFVKGMESTIWHEVHDKGYRRHTYTPFVEGTFRIGDREFSIQHPWSSQRKRDCEQSDTEEGESPSGDYCEEGHDIGEKGIYSGYDYTGDDDEAMAAHLKLGNDSYAQEVSQLEGDLMFLGNVEAVCENITDSNAGSQQIYIGLRQIEGPNDDYVGYENCHDVHG